MYKRLLVLLIATLLLTVIQSNAQPYPYLHLGEDDGLPSNNIYSLFRDSKGFMWIATDKGLARFDGIKYETYSTSNGLPHNDVFNIREDKWGRLWLGNFKGELCFYKDGKFHTAANTPWLKLGIKNVSIFNHMNVSPDGSLCQSSYDGNYFVSIDGDRVQLIYLGDFNSEFIFGKDLVYLPMRIRPNRFRLYGKYGYTDIDSNRHILKEHRYSFDGPHGFIFSSDGEYFLTQKGIFTLDENFLLSLKNYTYYSPKPLEITLYVTEPGTILTGNHTGVKLNDSIPLLKDLMATNIVSDTAGNYWVSTRGRGIYILSKHLLKLRKYTGYPGKIMTAKVVNGTLFLINNEGNIYSIDNGKINLRYSSESDTLNQGVLVGHNFLFPGDGSLLQLFDRRAVLFNGITKPGMLTPRIITMPERIGTLKEQILFNNQLYLFNISSLRQLDYKALVQKGMFQSQFLITAISDRSNRIFSRALDQQDGSIWISRSDGVFRLKDGQLIHQTGFRNIVFNQIALSGQYFYGISDANKLMIVNGYKSDVPTIDSLKDHNCIWETIYPIDDRHALVSTNNYYRLITFYPAAHNTAPRYKIQVIEDRLIPQRAEYIVTGTDYCYFFKDGNITSVATQVLLQKSAVPIPTFLSLKTSNKTWPIAAETSISYADSRNISLHFSNISFEGRELTCEYSISDNDTDNWTVTTGNEINLNTPGFGTYTIKVRAKTLSSGYSQPRALRLTILRPFWATWWFVTFSLLTLVVIVWGIILIATRSRLRKKQREHDTEMKFQQLEYKALNALMNPHFIFNSLNNIQGLINKDEKRVANEYLVIFSDLVRQNMHNISKGFITLQQELNLIENYLTLEKLRFKELVNYKMQIEDDVETEDIMIPPLMVQPLVENAVKHGLLPRLSSESLVSIHVFEKDDLLYIEITDNGVGLSQSLKSKNRLHESFGLVNLKKRTDHLKKIQQHDINIEVTEIKDDAGQVKGTRALIIMQLIEN